jgi:mannose-6-phosphate isomerase-like protein (cupin superfamily)
MRLLQPFLRLPMQFDASALAGEVRALPSECWVAHPTGFTGNEAVRLVTPFGAETDDLEGPMAPTAALERCAYVRQIMAAIGAVWGRSRFMGLAAGREVPSHIDTHHYWRTHHRIHIPVITNAQVLFTCGDETVHMGPGECWLFDSFRWHDVQNRGAQKRIHLVLDTVGGGLLPDLCRAAERPASSPRPVPPNFGAPDALAFETINAPAIMSPWEMRCHLAFIRSEAAADERLSGVFDLLERFIDEWAALWATFETDLAGRPRYALALARVRTATEAEGSRRLLLPNGLVIHRILEQLIFEMALRPLFAGTRQGAPASVAA